MSDIYDILSKHYTGESSEEEEQLVLQFKSENPEEYAALQKFWKQKNIQINEFDAEKAWNELKQKTGNSKAIPIYRTMKFVASIAAAFIFISILGFNFLNETNPIGLITNVVSNEEIKKIELGDGSIIHLNANSSLKYPEEFSSKTRAVTLIGEAFFEIAKDASRPFIIKTNHSEIEVLGTSFNIITESDQTEVSVATGKVKVTGLQNKNSAFLSPNQSAVITANNLIVSETENNNYIAWKTGHFEFRKSSINDVVKDLNSFYGGQLFLSKSDSDCQLTSTFKRLELSEIMEIIQLSCNIQFKKENGIYELY